jgi:hypothetical protein
MKIYQVSFDTVMLTIVLEDNENVIDYLLNENQNEYMIL